MTQKNMKPTGLQTNLQGNHNTSTLQTNSSYLIQPSIQRSISVTSLINENSNNHNYAQGNPNYLSPNGGVFRMDNRQQLNTTNTCPNGLNMIGSMNSNNPPNLLTSVSSPNANHGNHHHEVTKPKTKLEKFKDLIFKPNHSKHNKFTSYLDGQLPSKTNRERQEKIHKKSTDSLIDSIINNPSNVLAPLETVRIVAPPKTSEKFTMDLETKANVRDMFNKLDFEDQLKIQQRGLELLAEEYSRKLALFDDLKREINEKKRELDQIGQPIRSPLNIEKLRGEIRALTNEKAELEYRISLNSNWTCKKCTYCLNSNRLTKCTMCNIERDENELFLCVYCNTKNSLFNRNCTNCNAHFNSASLSRESNISGSFNSINSTMSNPANTNSNLLTSRRSTGSSASPTPTPSPLHNSSSFLSSPFMPSLISSPQPNNNNSTSQYNPI